MKTLLTALLISLFYFQGTAQTYIFFATQPEAFLDSTCSKKIRKLTKGEVMHIENLIPYKKKYLYAHCLKDGKAGFIDKAHIKMEKTYYPDSLGKDPIDVAYEEFKSPYIRFYNSSHHAVLKISVAGRSFILKPGQREEFKIKAGTARYKVETPGYQPLYANETLNPYHINDIDLFIE